MSLVNGSTSFNASSHASCAQSLAYLSADSQSTHLETYVNTGLHYQEVIPNVYIITKSPAFVLGEKLYEMSVEVKKICSYVYSRLPSFSLPGAAGASVEIDPASPCQHSSVESNFVASYASSPCVTPVGSYEESCNKAKISYSAETNECEITTRCATILEGLPHKANARKYKPGEHLTLVNINGTLSVPHEIEEPSISAEEANKKLAEYSQSIKAIDEKIEQLEIEGIEQEKLEEEKAGLVRKQGKIIGSLKTGDIITFNRDRQPVIITPENRGEYAHLYSSETLETFNELAHSTEGIMGLSPSADSLPYVIDLTFEHILRSANPHEPLDIAFVLDTTSSMGDDIIAVKQNLIGLLERLNSKKSKSTGAIRVALLEYRDKEDRFINRVNTDFTPDFDMLVSNLKEMDVSGGGDYPEAVLDALFSAQQDLSWNRDTKRAVILIGDAPPHPQTADKAYSATDLVKLYKDKKIKISIYPIITSS